MARHATREGNVFNCADGGAVGHVKLCERFVDKKKERKKEKARRGKAQENELSWSPTVDDERKSITRKSETANSE